MPAAASMVLRRTARTSNPSRASSPEQRHRPEMVHVLGVEVLERRRQALRVAGGVRHLGVQDAARAEQPPRLGDAAAQLLHVLQHVRQHDGVGAARAVGSANSEPTSPVVPSSDPVVAAQRGEGSTPHRFR